MAEDQNKMKNRELGWNQAFSKASTPRRNITASSEIREFILSSTSGVSVQSLLGADSMYMEQQQLQPIPSKLRQSKDKKMEQPSLAKTKRNVKSNLQQSKSQRKLLLDINSNNNGNNAFGTIAHAFGFVHHTGTDRNLELHVFKQILVRESLLMKLTHQSESNKQKASSGSKILEILTHIRNVTVEYCERLSSWRGSISHEKETFSLLPFLWEGDNYTLKICNDLDFLANNHSLVEALGMTQSKLRSNPLMLPNTLEEVADAWIEPHVRASYDAGGQTKGLYYEERLRLRTAERMLLQEIEVNSYGDAGSAQPIDEYDRSDQIAAISTPNQHIPNPNMVEWQNQAVRQLDALSRPNTGPSSRIKGLPSIGPESGRLRSPSTLIEQHSQSYNGNMNNNNFNNPRSGSSGWSGTIEAFPAVAPLPQVGGGSRPRVTNGQGRTHNRRDNAGLVGNDDFPENGGLDSIDSNVTFYEAFGGFEGEAFSENGILGPGDIGGDMSDNQDGFNYYTEWDDLGDSLDGPEEAFLQTEASYTTSSSIVPICMLDLEMAIEVRSPPQRVMLAGAACVILLTDGVDEAISATWDQFMLLARSMDLAAAMNSLDPASIPYFKIRAIKPFIDKMRSSTPSAKEGSGKAIQYCDKICRWVRHVVASASGTVLRDPIPAIGPANTAKKTKKNGTETSPKAVAAASKDAPKKKQQSNSLSLWPVHTEILEDIYKHPLLLTLLSSEHTQSRASYQSFDPMNLLGGDAPPDRLVVKVYDLVDSTEAIININIREYTLLLYDLVAKHDAEVQSYFRPASVDWWIAQLKRVIVVRSRPSRGLLLYISKAAIERAVLEGLGRIPSSMPPQQRFQQSNQEELDEYADDGDFQTTDGSEGFAVITEDYSPLKPQGGPKSVRERRMLRDNVLQEIISVPVKSSKSKDKAGKVEEKRVKGRVKKDTAVSKSGPLSSITAPAPLKNKPKAAPSQVFKPVLSAAEAPVKPADKGLAHGSIENAEYKYKDDFNEDVVVDDDGDGDFEEALARLTGHSVDASVTAAASTSTVAPVVKQAVEPSAAPAPFSKPSSAPSKSTSQKSAATAPASSNTDVVPLASKDSALFASNSLITPPASKDSSNEESLDEIMAELEGLGETTATDAAVQLASGESDAALAELSADDWEAINDAAGDAPILSIDGDWDNYLDDASAGVAEVVEGSEVEVQPSITDMAESVESAPIAVQSVASGAESMKDDGTANYSVADFDSIVESVDDARKPARFEVGAKIEGNYRGKGTWYPGKISRDRGDGTFDIDYDDGENEMHLAEDLIRLLTNTSTASESEPADATQITVPSTAVSESNEWDCVEDEQVPLDSSLDQLMHEIDEDP